LPASVQKLASENYALLRRDPRHPSLQFKKVGNYWSVRVGLRSPRRRDRRGISLDLDWLSCRVWQTARL